MVVRGEGGWEEVARGLEVRRLKMGWMTGLEGLKRGPELRGATP